MRKKLAVITAGAAVALLSTVSVGQEVRPVPGPGTGIATVTGTVDISSLPPVTQAGDWKVVVASPADVRVIASPPLPPLEFLKAGRRYLITWTETGNSEPVVVVQPGSGEWARVESGDGRRRWINLGAARQVVEVDGSPR